MRRKTIALLLFTWAGSLCAQVPGDSLSFMHARRMSEADLLKKREGTFFTGIPDLSSDPVTGFGFGIRGNVYWNGQRDDRRFAYTPYLAKLKANAAWYTSNARELVLSLDVPYYKGTRWRFKVDIKAQQNPANLYFGLTEGTLGPLRLPSDPSGPGFATYTAYDAARSVVRPGGPGEAAFVTDALSNRFLETEYMLNLKADYTLGRGRWRVMGGYEIQHLSYVTFEGTDTQGRDPVTGEEVTVPNGLSLLRRESDQGLVSGVDGGRVSIVQGAIMHDTRDFEPDPTKGHYLEVANEYASPAIGSQFTFNKLFVQARAYRKLPIGRRTVIAARIGAGTILGDQAPFFEFQDQWSPDGSINALGGKGSLRGYRANRFLARSLWFANLELRARVAELSLGKQHFGIGAAPFVDVGTVRDRWQDLDLAHLRTAYGAGLRIAWNQSTIIFLDYGVSPEDRLLFFGIGQVF
ncbi:MAG: BamA/TamA family outer membrane protein [Flavobacteriales bacterium]|nr:BamA/TamA family outer membrane protein [Flavobacteriales bacterium]